MLRQRILVALVGIPVLGLILIAGPIWVYLLLLVLITAACVELAGLLDHAGYPVQPAVAGALAVVIAVSFVLPWGAALRVVVLVVAAGVAILREPPSQALQRLLGTLLTVAAAAMLSGLIVVLTGAVWFGTSGPLKQWLDEGSVLLLVVVLTVWAYDTAAYTVGRLYPRGHFFNYISPNKTWSGAIGGLVGATIAGYLLGVLIGRPTEILGLGFIVGLAAPIGDLAESLVKRAAGVKDSSRIFPGHGGVLDRMDSFLAVAPIAWLYLVAVNLVNR